MAYPRVLNRWILYVSSQIHESSISARSSLWFDVMDIFDRSLAFVLRCGLGQSVASTADGECLVAAVVRRDDPLARPWSKPIWVVPVAPKDRDAHAGRARLRSPRFRCISASLNTRRVLSLSCVLTSSVLVPSIGAGRFVWTRPTGAFRHRRYRVARIAFPVFTALPRTGAAASRRFPKDSCASRR